MTEQYDQPEACSDRDSIRSRRPIDDERTGSDEGFELDDLFRVLADRRRRYALYQLRRADGGVRLPALVSTVLKWETGEDPRRVPEQRHQRTYLDFYHNHVPMLADYGLASYDEDDGTVRLETDLGDATAHVELARINDGVHPADNDIESRGDNSIP